MAKTTFSQYQKKGISIYYLGLEIRIKHNKNLLIWHDHPIYDHLGSLWYGIWDCILIKTNHYLILEGKKIESKTAVLHTWLSLTKRKGRTQLYQLTKRNVTVTQILAKHWASRILTRLYCKDCKMQQNYDKVQNGVIYKQWQLRHCTLSSNTSMESPSFHFVCFLSKNHLNPIA